MTSQQLKKIDAKIKKELSKQNFGGFSGEAEMFQYDWKSFKGMCSGHLVLAIGEGKFNRMLEDVMNYAVAYDKYQEAKRVLRLKYDWHPII